MRPETWILALTGWAIVALVSDWWWLSAVAGFFVVICTLVIVRDYAAQRADRRRRDLWRVRQR